MWLWFAFAPSLGIYTITIGSTNMSLSSIWQGWTNSGDALEVRYHVMLGGTLLENPMADGACTICCRALGLMPCLASPLLF